MDRDQSLRLLRDQHTFPGPFVFRAFVRPDGRAAVVTAVRASLGPGSDVISVEERVSREGRWVSLHLSVQVTSAEDVLGIYDVLRALEEVVLAM